ncbi:hypothetical protein [Clostridium botulinum]|uniref:hypothetical protein n=1 Tax=Clostridium botulinum TaxID=1491 RepID=UPI000304E59E|nr:hypothetical protein [Clostridium botulinum]APC82180.1 hypothetical protein NPD12_3732 [Clostridium botulinum]MBY6850390.1 hypothetical protein [Clostridium botulinum]MBY6857450.1 hypothetical protein [Clostridium botulinum]MBY6967420.1 hypothetical protein [Clostridium botulinum]HBJ1682522.1 hypothetical protein [Clostridium botulinum]
MDNLEELFTEVLMRLHIELAKNKSEEEKKALAEEMREYKDRFDMLRGVENK